MNKEIERHDVAACKRVNNLPSLDITSTSNPRRRCPMAATSILNVFRKFI